MDHRNYKIKYKVSFFLARIYYLVAFFLFQHPVLNKRLGIVIFEGIFELLFHEQDFKTIFQKLHSRSTRVRNELKNSQRKYADFKEKIFREKKSDFIYE